MSSTTKSVVASFEVNVNTMDASLVVEPLAMMESPVMLVAVMVMVGAILSYVQVKVDAAILLFPAASLKAPPAISMVVACTTAVPEPVGVKVAV